MTAGNDQAQKWRFQIRMLYIVCRNMSFDMMHSYQWKFLGIGNGFCLCYAHKKRSYKSWSVSYTDRVQIIQSNVSFFESLLDDLVYFLDMFTGSDLRDNSSV